MLKRGASVVTLLARDKVGVDSPSIVSCFLYKVLFNNVYNRFLLIILGSINTLTCTIKYIWCSYRSLVVTLASEVVF